MKPKRRKNEKSPAKIDSYRDIKAIEQAKETQITKLKRCKEWLQTQISTKIQLEDDIGNEDDDIIETSVPSDSLVELKHFTGKKTKQSILFVCEWFNCLKKFVDKSELYNHIVVHIKSLKHFHKKYICQWDLCYFQTTCNAEMARHINFHAYHTVLKTYGESLAEQVLIPPCRIDSKKRNLIPDLPNDFFCYWNDCKRNFKSIFLYYEHIKDHCIFEQNLSSSSKKNKYICKWEYCEKSFTNNYRLKEHLRKHTFEKVVGCFQCGSLFSSNTIFFDHCHRQEDNNAQEFQCNTCLKHFSSERLLRKHVSLHIHYFKCSLCDMTCASSFSLSKHMRYRHINERPIECTMCDCKFVEKNDLNRHIMYVHEKKVFKCDFLDCTYNCKSIYTLKKHHSSAHSGNEEVYGCHCCEKVYKRGIYLSKHLIKFHGFQYPFGHKRFLYRPDDNGIYRLQTMRIESLEVTKQILKPTTPENIFSSSDLKINSEHANLSEKDWDETSSYFHTENESDPEGNIRNSNTVIITIKDVDKDGNIIATKYTSATEINI